MPAMLNVLLGAISVSELAAAFSDTVAKVYQTIPWKRQVGMDLI